MKQILFFIIIFQIKIYGQPKHDVQWIFENYNLMDFRSGSPIISKIEPPEFYPSPGSYTTTICDKYGNLLFHTAGCFIMNKNHRVMLNGSDINSELTYRGWCKDGLGDFPIEQNVTILPYPSDSTKYLILNIDFNDIFPLGSGKLPVPTHLFMNIVDMTKDNNLGEVIEAKKVIVSDTLSRGYVQATYHKNKNDWWIIVPKWNSNCFYTVKVSAQGVDTPKLYCLGKKWTDNDLGGQVTFSPDGKKYVRIDSDHELVIYDFDNENGVLSNPKLLLYPRNENYARGVCFSSDSRYLYVIARTQVFQYDTFAQDIQASSQLVGDVKESLFTNDKGFLAFNFSGF